MQANHFYSTLLFSIVFLLGTTLNAQQQRFQAGVLAGFNLAELEGTGIGSYFGLNVGAIVTGKIARQWQLSLELLYSQDGEYSLPEFYPPVEYGSIRLHFLEIPLHIDFLTKNDKAEGYNNWHLALGAAYARLMNYKVSTTEGLEITDDIIWEDRDAILVQGGATYFFTPHIGLNLRGTVSTDSSFLGWTVALRAVYLI